MPPARCVVGAVVVRRSADGPEVLAARRTTPPVDSWEFPGGKVEPGETPAQALVRELQEELGCTVTVGPEVTDGDGGRQGWAVSETLVLRLFLAEITVGEPVPGDSHDEVRWLPLRALDQPDWLPSDRQALPAVRSAVRGAVLRAVPGAVLGAGTRHGC